MTPGIQSSTAAANTGEEWGPTPPPTAKADKNMFLELLVAQMRNQDPMNPTQGAEFVAQLAQFEQLESSMNMAQDIKAIRDQLAPEPTDTATV